MRQERCKSTYFVHVGGQAIVYVGIIICCGETMFSKSLIVDF